VFEFLAGVCGEARVLLATFVRVRDTLDQVEVERSDGSRVTWTLPSYRGSLPHDVVHLVFDLKKAFWAAVDAGSTPEHIHDRARRHGGAGSMLDDAARREMLVAEGLTGIHWYDPFVDGDARCEDIAQSCSAFGVRPPPTLDAARAVEAHRVLVGLRAAWRSAGSCAPLTIPFAANAPSRSFAALTMHFESARRSRHGVRVEG
jgi:hypothetical protein